MGYETRYRLDWRQDGGPMDSSLSGRISDYISSNSDVSYCLNPDGSSSQSGCDLTWDEGARM